MIFDVKDYGAIGDGVTDDAAAIQATLDAAGGVGRVLLSAGTYFVGIDPVVPSRSNIRGENATILVSRKGAAAGLVVAPGASNVFMHGFDVRGPWAGIDTAAYVGGGNLATWNAEYAENIGIDIRGRWYQREVLGYTKTQMGNLTDESTNITIKRVDIEGFGQSGILADQVTGFLAERNRIRKNGRDGIRLYGVMDGVVAKNTIGNMFAAYADGDAPNFNMYGVACTRLYGKAGHEDPNLTIGRPTQDVRVDKNMIHQLHTWKGLDTHGGVNISFTNNTIEDCNIGIGLDKGGYTEAHGIAPARDILISGNTFRQTKNSRYMRAAITAYGHDGSDDQLLDGAIITGNSFGDWGGGDTDSCVSVSNVTGVVVGGNRFKRPPLSAVRLAGRVEGFICDGNAISDPAGYCTLQVTDGGAGYTSRPDVTVTGGGGEGMRIYAKTASGVVTKLKLLHPGWGYTSAPTVTISGGSGSGALAATTYYAPFGVQVGTGQAVGTITGNTFGGKSPYESVRLSTPQPGYGVTIGADNTFSGEALRPAPANLSTGPFLSNAMAWANINLSAVGATIRSSLGIEAVARSSKGAAQVTLSRPLLTTSTAAPLASVFDGGGATASVSVTNKTTLTVTVRDAWGAPKDGSFYLSVFGY